MQPHSRQSVRRRSRTPDLAASASRPLQVLDLTQVATPRNDNRRDHMSQESLLASHSECLAREECGPLAFHPYCPTHCTNRHITYESNTHCFSAPKCWRQIIWKAFKWEKWNALKFFIHGCQWLRKVENEIFNSEFNNFRATIYFRSLFQWNGVKL